MKGKNIMKPSVFLPPMTCLFLQLVGKGDLTPYVNISVLIKLYHISDIFSYSFDFIHEFHIDKSLFCIKEC